MMWEERPRWLRACEWCFVSRNHVLRHWCVSAFANGCKVYCNPLRFVRHAQQSASLGGGRGGSARRGLLRHRGCAACGLGGVEQAGGLKTHLLLYPKRCARPLSIVCLL